MLHYTHKLNLEAMLRALDIDIIALIFVKEDLLVVDNSYNEIVVFTTFIANYSIGRILIKLES